MKTTHWLLIAMLAGGSAIAEEAIPNPERPQRGERPIPAAILKEFDKDGDGKLSPEERKQMRSAMRERRQARHQELLNRFDADGDGSLSPEERKVAHETVRKEMLAKYDANGDGELDPEERRAMIKAELGNPLAPFMRHRGPRGERGGPGAERRERRADGEGRPRGERRQRGDATPAPTDDE